MPRIYQLAIHLLSSLKSIRRQLGKFGVPAILLFFLVQAILPTSQANAAPSWQDSVPDATHPRPEKITKPVLIEFKGEINGELTAYFNNRFRAAKKLGADLLIVEIDSPGGLKIESLQMARMLRDCEWAYTIAIIRNEAISGGALVSLGVDEIFIDPNAKFGDAGEIGFDTEEWAWRLIEPKIESYLSRDARDLAESKKRPRDLAEAMVDKDVLVYIRPNPDFENGESEFKAVRADADPKPSEPWILIPETGPERFLTLSGQRAVELGLAQGHDCNREDVASVFGFEIDELHVYRPTLADSVAYFLNRPWVTTLLIFVGLVALYFELSAPGISIGGLVSGLCVFLFFWSRFLGGTSGWLEIVLFLAGMIFLIVELFVIPGFGVPGIAGLCLMLSSVLLASQDFTLPSTSGQWNQSLTNVIIVLISSGGFLVAATQITRRFGTLPLFNRLILAPPIQNDERGSTESKSGSEKSTPLPHPSISIGDWGKSISPLRPAGRAVFSDTSFDVVSDGSYIESASQVRVINIKGNIITVTSIQSESG